MQILDFFFFLKIALYYTFRNESTQDSKTEKYITIQAKYILLSCKSSNKLIT